MRRRIVMAVAVGLVFFSLSDVLLWQRIFEAQHLYQYDAAYQTGHRAVLLGMIALGVVLLYEAALWAVWYALAFYTLAWGGVADVLYYWLDGRALPAALPWLNENRLMTFKPITNSSLLLNVALWLAFWTATLIVLPRLELTIRRALSPRPTPKEDPALQS